MKDKNALEVVTDILVNLNSSLCRIQQDITAMQQDMAYVKQKVTDNRITEIENSISLVECRILKVEFHIIDVEKYVREIGWTLEGGTDIKMDALCDTMSEDRRYREIIFKTARTVQNLIMRVDNLEKVCKGA